jgi:hypothetical protein
MSRSLPLSLLLFFLDGSPISAQATQTDAGEYTRYELLAPSTARFKIRYQVWATTPGAQVYFNPIRKGSEATDEAVYDQATGAALEFALVEGREARSQGFAEADTGTRYIRVKLPRPVPRDGMVRLMIEKTYRDPKSYLVDGDRIVFSRSLSIKRNAVVLPVGYELIGCNVPSQVLTEADGRTLISFINGGPDPVSLVVRGRKLR